MDEEKKDQEVSLLDVDLDAVLAEGKKKSKKKQKNLVITVAALIALGIAGFLTYQYSQNAKREATYQEAVTAQEAGDYNTAISLFGEVGDYKDSKEQINMAIEGETKTLMGKSLLDAYTYLENLPGDFDFKQEFEAKYKQYIPYCGEFATDGGERLTSYFRLIGDKVCWYVLIPSGDRMGIYNGTISNLHYFFTGRSTSELAVENMEVNDEDRVHGCIGTARFKNGKVYIKIVESDYSHVYWDRVYSKVA